MSRGGIPERWLNCPPRGQVVEGSRFIPFKVPLNGSFNDQIPPPCYFTPQMMIDSCAADDTPLGLIINVANTERYYDRAELPSGVAYLHLPTRGHEEEPTADQTKAFIGCAQTFWNSHPDKYIGVHCTHGHNRTGFLIASFLFEEGHSCSSALLAFQTARPPGIYKESYVRALYARCNDDDILEELIPASGSVLWEHDDAALVVAGEDLRRKRPSDNDNDLVERDGQRIVSGAPEAMKGVVGSQLVSGREEAEVQRACRELCNVPDYKGFTGSQPVSVCLGNMNLLAEGEYRVSWKADGERFLMLVAWGTTYFVDRANRVYRVNGLCFPDSANSDVRLDMTLVDGELVHDRVKGPPASQAKSATSTPTTTPPQVTPELTAAPSNPPPPAAAAAATKTSAASSSTSSTDRPAPTTRACFLMFDLIALKGTSVASKKYSHRLELIRQQIQIPRDALRKKQPNVKQALSVSLKPFYTLNYITDVLQMAKTGIGHKSDGLLFAPENEPYKVGRFDRLLKWKPPEQNSVDFWLQVEVRHQPGCPRETVGVLQVIEHGQPCNFSEMKPTPDFPISSLQKYDGKIIECALRPTGPGRFGWKFLCERTDKEYPNSLNTANNVIGSFRDNIVEQTMIKFVMERGFGVRKLAMEREQKKRKAREAVGRDGQTPPMHSAEEERERKKRKLVAAKEEGEHNDNSTE